MPHQCRLSRREETVVVLAAAAAAVISGVAVVVEVVATVAVVTVAVVVEVVATVAVVIMAVLTIAERMNLGRTQWLLPTLVGTLVMWQHINLQIVITTQWTMVLIGVLVRQQHLQAVVIPKVCLPALGGIPRIQPIRGQPL